MSNTRDSTTKTQAALIAAEIAKLKAKQSELSAIIYQEEQNEQKRIAEEKLILQKAWFDAAKNQNVEKLNELFSDVRRFNLLKATSKLKDEYYLMSFAKACALQYGNVSMLTFLFDLVKDMCGESYSKIWLNEEVQIQKNLQLLPQINMYQGILHPYYENGVAFPPLVFALRNKDAALAVFLIQHCLPNTLTWSRRDTYYGNYVEFCIQYNMLSIAIENNMTEAAILLIQKGAPINVRHTYSDLSTSELYNLENPYDHLRELTLLMLACKTNNFMLVDYLLQHGAKANEMTQDIKREQAIDFTSSEEIKQLLLSYYTFRERLDRIDFDGEIPQKYLNPNSDSRYPEIMERPAIYENIPFCKRIFLRVNKGGSAEKLVAPDGKQISLREFERICDLPVDQALTAEIRHWVSEQEKTVCAELMMSNQKNSP